MPDSDEERERELTELLHEVRALRQTIERLQAGQAGGPAPSPEYPVPVQTEPELPPEYQAHAGEANPEGEERPASDS